MAFQLLLNFFIALVWMFMSTSFTASTFIIGLLDWSAFDHYDETIFHRKTVYLATLGSI